MLIGVVDLDARWRKPGATGLNSQAHRLTVERPSDRLLTDLMAPFSKFSRGTQTMCLIKPSEVPSWHRIGPSDEDPRNALVQAAAQGDLQTLRRLRREHRDLDLDGMDDQGSTALTAAISHGHLGMMKELVWSGASIDLLVDGLSPLHQATVNGRCDMVQALLAFGADVNQESGRGETALTLAIRNGHFDVARLLLKQDGIQVNVTNQDGESALAEAVSWGNAWLVRRLVKAGAQVDLREGDADSAFVRAFRVKDKRMMKLLLDLGADINQASSPNTGTTLLAEAEKAGHLHKASWLIAHGAKRRRLGIDRSTTIGLASIYPRSEERLRPLQGHGRTAIGSRQPESLLRRARQREDAEWVEVMRGLREVGVDTVGVDWRHEDLRELPPGLRDLGLREGDRLNITDNAGITASYRVVLREEDEGMPQQGGDPSSRNLLLQRQA